MVIFIFIPTARRALSTHPYYAWIPASHMEAFHYLREKTPPDAAVLHPYEDDPIYSDPSRKEVAWIFKDHYYYMSGLGERAAVSEGSLKVVRIKAPLTPEQVDQRRADIKVFYQTKDPGLAEEILRRYSVDYVWVDKKAPLSFEVASVMTGVFENGDVVIYKKMRVGA